jgi:hypothetical protein
LTINQVPQESNAEYLQKWRENNRDKIKEYNQRAYKNNKEKRQVLNKKYYKEHREELIEVSKKRNEKYKKENKEKRRNAQKELILSVWRKHYGYPIDEFPEYNVYLRFKRAYLYNERWKRTHSDKEFEECTKRFEWWCRSRGKYVSTTSILNFNKWLKIEGKNANKNKIS